MSSRTRSGVGARRDRESRRAPARAFTLVELLVAVAVVAVLTLGIGQIFGSVSRLVGTGAAVAEVDQMARTVESQLRQDFAAMSRADAEDTFLAIRNTRLGDFDFDGNLDNDEIDLYLSSEEDEADLRAEIDPYERDGNDRSISRAITTRLDEIMFVGKGSYVSYQGGQARESAGYALISYGHGLLPPPDPEADEDRPPFRQNYADGYFGDEAGTENRLAPDPSDSRFSVTGRNRYVSDFVLTRQALLLAGGRAMSYMDPDGMAPFVPDARPPFGEDTEYALLPRDLEGAAFAGTFNGAGDAGVADDPAVWPLGGPARDDNTLGVNSRLISKERLIRHGRTDICAVAVTGDRNQLRTWLQGEGGPFDPTSDGLAGQLYYDPDPTVYGLWQVQTDTGPPLPLRYRLNLRGLQSAIAGMFRRMLVETEPPELRVDPDEYQDAGLQEPDPRDRRMDMHAILAEHCIGFEVAWSDGSRWHGGQNGNDSLIVDLDGDGRGFGPNEREFAPGSVIWFDMDFTFRDFWDALDGYGLTTPQRKQQLYPRPNPDPEIGLTEDRMFTRLPLVNDPSETLPEVRRTHDTLLTLRLMDDSESFERGAYSTKYTQARFAEAPEASHEYLAIWGFQAPPGHDRDLRQPGSLGEYKGVWVKPKFVRIRMTLQDSQNRLDGGKAYEFIFRIDPN